MIVFLVLVAALHPTVPSPDEGIARDAYGVPAITASTREQAFFLAGKAAAQDRLWQMEMSRRVARGRMSEVFGRQYLASDREALQSGYTEDELKTQVGKSSGAMREAWEAYARGVNAHIEEARRAGTLPEGYGQAGFEPEPWTVLDSAAIAVQLGQRFGAGGAGELRNYAAYLYLKSQPCKDRVLDVMDDLAWQNDRRSPTTIQPEDDPMRAKPPTFPKFDRSDTLRQLESNPARNLLELAGAIRLASREDTTRVALAHSVPYKTGSYAVVVAPARSRTGAALLLSGPQMGHSTPSIVHEMSIDAPGLRVSGMDVPGIPGVLIGFTPTIAWGLTTGVADTQDVFFSKLVDGDRYRFGSSTLPLERIELPLRVKGEAGQTVVQTRTRMGRVVLESKASKCVFSQKSSFFMRELEGFDALYSLYNCRSADELESQTRRIPLGFNLFYATTQGDVGYAYCGMFPQRATGLDPRFPAEASPETDWKGVVPLSSLVHARNPKSGYFANWNNKPVSWWPNLDTPAWGRLFRSQAVVDALGTGKLGLTDLERVPWQIARRDTATHQAFMPWVSRALRGADLSSLEQGAADLLLSWDGWLVDGSQGGAVYQALVRALRQELFLPHTGSFLTPDVFSTVVQPSVMLTALEGKTAYRFLGDRRAEDVVLAAFRQAVAGLSKSLGNDPGLWRYRPGTIAVPGEPPIPYGDRGTFIQIVELRKRPVGRSVNSPGIAESGPHRLDQAPLARGWHYKPMRGW